MQNLIDYRKFATLTNGKKVVIRFLKDGDRDGLIRFFQEAPAEDIQFCKEEVKNPKSIDYWLNPANSNRVMVIVAEDLATRQIIANLQLYRGQQAAKNIGEIQQMLVARSHQGFGLGSMMLEELIDLATKENFKWLKAEVATLGKNIIKAFQARGFEIRAVLEDYFIDQKGASYDVVLMVRNLSKEEEDF